MAEQPPLKVPMELMMNPMWQGAALGIPAMQYTQKHGTPPFAPNLMNFGKAAGLASNIPRLAEAGQAAGGIGPMIDMAKGYLKGQDLPSTPQIQQMMDVRGAEQAGVTPNEYRQQNPITWSALPGGGQVPHVRGGMEEKVGNVMTDATAEVPAMISAAMGSAPFARNELMKMPGVQDKARRFMMDTQKMSPSFKTSAEDLGKAMPPTAYGGSKRPFSWPHLEDTYQGPKSVLAKPGPMETWPERLTKLRNKATKRTGMDYSEFPDPRSNLGEPRVSPARYDDLPRWEGSPAQAEKKWWELSDSGSGSDTGTGLPKTVR